MNNSKRGFRKIISNKKAQVNPYIILVVAFILILLFMLIIISDITLSINIDKDTVDEGSNVILSYEISNDRFFDDAKNVELEYTILNSRNIEKKSEKIDIGIIKPRSKIQNNIILSTSNFDSGEYTIWVHLDYWISGKWETKHLSLKFNVI